MPPPLAALICVAFILYLFWTDRREGNVQSSALWIPLLWMFLAAGRFASSWLGMRPSTLSVQTYSEGSPIDAVVFSLLIAGGIFVLLRRSIDWQGVVVKNKWIWLYFLYCGLSVFWADDPFLSSKRWIKEVGNPVMVLVILTEARPYDALATILRRLAFLWLPISILFIKYYPELGRAYHVDGTQMFTGIGQQKNDLGLICLVVTIYFCWILLLKREGITGKDALLIGMLGWLFYLSDSKTAMVSSVVAVGLCAASRIPAMRRKPQRILILLTGGVLSFILLEETLNISEFAYRLMDRDPNLTSRTYIWDVLTEMVTNKLIGTGYQSFWTGDRVDAIVNTLGAEINQAHNGYIEQYLNLGYIGLFFIVVMVFSGLLKAQREMMVYPPWGILKLCIIATAMVYNYAEASFYGINNMWLLLLLACIEIPFRLAVGSAASAYAPTDRESRLSARARRPAAGRRQAEGVSRPRALGRRRGVGEPPK